MPFTHENAQSCQNIGAGRKRAAFWRAQGFPNLVLARAAKAEKRRLRKLEEWKQQELRRMPFALLDNPPPELAPPWSRLKFKPRRGY
jgi:hypothetical protein